jgi:hypothetical protein
MRTTATTRSSSTSITSTDSTRCSLTVSARRPKQSRTPTCPWYTPGFIDSLGAWNSTLGIEILDHRFDAALVPPEDRATGYLDVLLRHLLLRQPGGFQGFVVSHVVRNADRLPVPKGPDLSEVHLNHRPAARALAPLAAVDGHLIPVVD